MRSGLRGWGGSDGVLFRRETLKLLILGPSLRWDDGRVLRWKPCAAVTGVRCGGGFWVLCWAALKLLILGPSLRWDDRGVPRWKPCAAVMVLFRCVMFVIVGSTPCDAGG